MGTLSHRILPATYEIGFTVPSYWVRKLGLQAPRLQRCYEGTADQEGQGCLAGLRGKVYKRQQSGSGVIQTKGQETEKMVGQSPPLGPGALLEDGQGHLPYLAEG